MLTKAHIPELHTLTKVIFPPAGSEVHGSAVFAYLTKIMEYHTASDTFRHRSCGYVDVHESSPQYERLCTLVDDSIWVHDMSSTLGITLSVISTVEMATTSQGEVFRIGIDTDYHQPESDDAFEARLVDLLEKVITYRIPVLVNAADALRIDVKELEELGKAAKEGFVTINGHQLNQLVSFAPALIEYYLAGVEKHRK